MATYVLGGDHRGKALDSSGTQRAEMFGRETRRTEHPLSGIQVRLCGGNYGFSSNLNGAWAVNREEVLSYNASDQL